MKEYYRTRSVCPVCLDDVSARVVQKNGAAVMQKECPKHGAFEIVLCSYGDDWDWLRTFHDSVHPKNRRPREVFVLLAPTVRCNLLCPFCFMFAGNRPYREPTLDDLSKYFENHRHERIIVFGGEPTVREDLPEIMHRIRKSGNVPVLQSNGIRLADKEYVQFLKQAGLVEVFMTFDGFEDSTTQTLRGEPIADIRLEALKTLEQLNIPVFLSVTVGKGLNEHELSKIIDFATENPGIRGVYFRSCVPMGRNSPPENFIRSDEMLDRLAEQTGDRINFGNVLKFLALFNALQIYLNMERCWTEFYYVVFRRPGGGYQTISEILNLEAIMPNLKSFSSLRKKGRKGLATLYLLLCIPKVIRWNRLGAMLNIVRSFLNVAFHRRFGLGASQKYVTSATVMLGFNEICSANNLDQDKFPHCPTRTYDEDGHLVSFCENNLKRQRRWMAAKRDHGEKGAERARLG